MMVRLSGGGGAVSVMKEWPWAGGLNGAVFGSTGLVLALWGERKD